MTQSTKWIICHAWACFFTPADTQMLCWWLCAMYYCQILLKSPGLSVASGPRNVLRQQVRTFDIVKTWVFCLLNVQWMSFIDNLVHWNILRSIKAAFLEIEKTMFTVATLVRMFTIITPGHYTRSKQSKTIHANGTLEINCENNVFDNQKCLCECYSVTDLNRTVRKICHVVDNFFPICLMFFMNIVSLTRPLMN